MRSKSSKRLILSTLGVLVISFLHSQNVLSISPGAWGGAMGGIRSTHQNILSIYGNQAGLAFVDELTFYASAERRFNTEGLNFYSLLGALPTRYGNFGLNIFYHGYEAYNEKLIGLSYARKLIDKLALGARLDFVQASIPVYGSTSTVTAEVGIQSNISSSVLLGFHIYNPFEIHWLEGESLPGIFVLGIAYQPTTRIWISGELEKVSEFPENLKWGLQYKALDQLAIRVGFNTQPALFSFGIGYSLNSGMIYDIGTSVHQELGFSPMAGIGYAVDK